MRAQVLPLSSLRMMLWPIVPTTMVTSFIFPPTTPRTLRLPIYYPFAFSLSLNIDPMHISAARPGNRIRAKNLIQPREILLVQFDFGGLDVLFQVIACLVAWDRDDVVSLRHQPRQSQLRRGNAFLLRDPFKLRQQLEIAFEIAGLKARMIVSAIAVAHVALPVHDTGKKSAPQRRVRHETHVEFAAGLNVAAFRIARPGRIFHLQGGDWMNLARAPDRVRARLRQADVASQASFHQSRHRADGLFDRNIGIDPRHTKYIERIDTESFHALLAVLR